MGRKPRASIENPASDGPRNAEIEAPRLKVAKLRVRAWPSPYAPKPRALQPHHSNFSIGGQPLFPECQNYLNSTQALVTGARAIAAGVHGTQPLTVPPA